MREQLSSLPTSSLIRLITNTVFVKSVIYGRKETGFFEGESQKFAARLSRKTLQANFAGSLAPKGG
jgi:hypothetical protein